MLDLRYGNNLSLRLDINGDANTTTLEVPRGQALTDVSGIALSALRSPIDYPPLAQCVTPADRVVLALDHGVPQVAHLVAAVIETLLDAGVSPEAITVLQSHADHLANAEDPRQLAPAAVQKQVALRFHNPADRRDLAYLAADKAGEAIMINRALHEADVILPISCLRDSRMVGYFGIHGGVYPTFSDVKTQQRFRGIGAVHAHGHCHCHDHEHAHGQEHGHEHAHQHGQDEALERRRELAAGVEHVAWLLGLMFTVQVVPAAGDKVMHVLAGQSDSVRRRGEALYKNAWSAPADRRAGLVIATIEGGPNQQTWENVGHALRTAEHFVEADGAIAVCCDLKASPGAAMQHLLLAESPDSALKHIARERPEDALAAAQLVQSLAQHKVYMLSQVDATVLEELDVVPVEKPEELARLVHQHSACLVLPNAPFVAAEAIA
jgi:nickel-dependent lactate racemase